MRGLKGSKKRDFNFQDLNPELTLVVLEKDESAEVAKNAIYIFQSYVQDASEQSVIHKFLKLCN